MKDFFLQNIKIDKCKPIENLEIPLSQDKRLHLIITGKNGSGKTTLLRSINEIFSECIGINIKSNVNDSFGQWVEEYDRYLYKLNRIQLIFSHNSSAYNAAIQGNFIFAFFEAKRENMPNVPKEIKNVNLNTINTTNTNNLHKEFISYMVRLRNTMLNAKEDGDTIKTKKIQKWFNNFENTLKDIFEEQDLKLKYINEQLNFKITYKDREFGLNELSDGYSSLIAILTELILRMEAKNIKSCYDMQGVVLIDEIETHLHIELQKKVFPFLSKMFPKIQFIVTTHSPFVLSSMENVVICDLEQRIITQDLSAYSYDALVESYFDSDKYSQNIKEIIQKYDNLSNKQLTQEQLNQCIKEFEEFTNNISKFKALELITKIDEIKLKFLTQRK